MDCINAAAEFTEHTLGKSRVKCALISKGDPDMDDAIRISLPEGYSSSEGVNFFKNLDFIYDSGYGGQKLFGIIWYEDGTWSERGEYDGSEWWVHRVVPAIPFTLRKE